MEPPLIRKRSLPASLVEPLDTTAFFSGKEKQFSEFKWQPQPSMVALTCNSSPLPSEVRGLLFRPTWLCHKQTSKQTAFFLALLAHQKVINRLPYPYQQDNSWSMWPSLSPLYPCPAKLWCIHSSGKILYVQWNACVWNTVPNYSHCMCSYW